MNAKIDVYEIPNTFTPDFSLDKQIELKICDWQADFRGCAFFGRSKEEAVENCVNHFK